MLYESPWSNSREDERFDCGLAFFQIMNTEKIRQNAEEVGEYKLRCRGTSDVIADTETNGSLLGKLHRQKAI